MQDTRTPTGFRAALFSVVMIVTIIVVFQNTATVQTKVLFSTVAMPLALLLGLVLASGMLSGAVLYHTLGSRRRRHQ